MEMKRQTKTLKWYLKDFAKAITTEPIDWALAAYVTVGCLAAVAGVGLGKVIIFLINNFVGV